MKKTLILYAVLTLVCLSFGCGGAGMVDSVQFSDNHYVPEYASGFRVDADEAGNRLLRVTRPWQGIAPVEQSLAIFNDEASAEGYEGQYIVGAAKRIVCMSTSHIAMLDVLGMVDRVVGVSGKQYVMNEAIAGNPEVKDVGYDSNLDYEELMLLNPDVVLMYGVSAENTAVTAKLRELAIPYIYLGDYVEQLPLGKAEWLMAIAEIGGCDEEGREIFDAIVERYVAVQSSVSEEADKPKVMLNTPYQDVWYMPSDSSYLVRLIEDAGGEYIYGGRNNGYGSVGISLEEAYMLVTDADLWLNVGQCMTIDEVKEIAPHFQDADVVRRGDIFNNNRRRTAAGGSDFWESAIVHPDVVLQDLITIFSGDSDDELYYHHRLK